MQNIQNGINSSLKDYDVGIDLLNDKGEANDFNDDIKTVRPVRIIIENIMGIGDLDIDLSSAVNVFIGENGTGKTSVIKCLYSLIAGLMDADHQTKMKLQNGVEQKIQQVFRPENNKIGNIVKEGIINASVRIIFDNGKEMHVEFGSSAASHVNLDYDDEIKSGCPIVYIPPKEMVSVDGFVSLYENYSISFEEMYNRIARQLSMPAKKHLSDEIQVIVDDLAELIEGKVILHNGRLYLEEKETGHLLEMGLLSEGYKKIITLLQLVVNGNIKRGSVLIWDEPETNMNPKMSVKLVNALNALAKNGVQVIITTHDYFVAQEFGLIAKYDAGDMRYCFNSLYKEGGIRLESNDDLFEIFHNPIMEEFDSLYERENILRWKEPEI